MAAGGSDAGGEKVVLAGHGVDLGEVFGVGGDDERGCGFGEKAEERMSEQRRVLLDGGADVFGEGGLRKGHGNAAVGDVAGGMNEFAPGEHGQQIVQAGLGFEIERGRSAPETAENDFGELRGAEGGEVGCGFRIRCIRLRMRTPVRAQEREAAIG